MKRLTYILCVFLPLCVLSPARAEVTDGQVKEVAKELACLCGSCPRRPLDECSCGWADKHRTRIARALEAGQDKKTIVAGFIKDFGQEVLSAPPKTGFNLLAWIMPFLALALGGVVVRAVILSWSRNTAPAREAAASQPPSDVDDALRAKLERELKERDL